jgi:hypothetical protein
MPVLPSPDGAARPALYPLNQVVKEQAMRTSLRIAAIVAIAIGASNLALADGPVRQGLRGAAEVTGNVVQGVAQGTANVARGVGNATLNVAQGTGHALGLTPPVPAQARNGAIVDGSRDARWRFAQHNGEWWYYNNNNQWQYHRDGQWQTFSQDNFQPTNQQLAQDQQMHAAQQQGQQHMSAYRGPNQGNVMHDHQGRAYVCENGRAVYLDQQQSMPQQHGVGYADPNAQGMNQAPAEPTPANGQDQTAVQGQADAQGQAAVQSAPAAAAPATAAPAANGQISGDGTADVSSAPVGGNTGSQAQGDVAAPREINNNPTPQTSGATDNPGQ